MVRKASVVVKKRASDYKKTMGRRPERIKMLKVDNLSKLSTIAHDCSEVLRSVQFSIWRGRTPVLLLPDTSMRAAGHLFNAALVAAFPEIYKPLKKFRMQAVLYAFAKQGYFERPAEVELPEVIKKIPNVEVFVVDAYVTGTTVQKIKQELNKRFPQIPVSLVVVDELALNLEAKRRITLKRVGKAKGNFVYEGRGGVFKLIAEDSTGDIKQVPNRITATEAQWMRSQQRWNESKSTPRLAQDIFWKSRDFKRILSSIGRSIGKDYRER